MRLLIGKVLLWLAPKGLHSLLRRSHNEEKSLDPVIRRLLDDAVGRETALIVLDVGANEGQSITRFESYLDRMIIHTFEPIPSCHALMSNRFQGSKYVHNCVAVSNTHGLADFYELAKPNTSSLLQPDLDSSWAIERAEGYAGGDLERLVAGRYKVPTTSLDLYLRNSEQLADNRIHLLKMDTQGHEDKVLEGATDLLSDPLRRPLLIESEIILGSAYETHLNFLDIERHLVPRGYRLVALDRAGNLLDSPALGLNVLYASPELASQIPR